VRTAPPGAAPLASPPAVPLPSRVGGAKAPRSWRRAVLVALLVALVGGAAGAVLFIAEQRLVVWKPDVTELPGGVWRVTGSAGLRPQAPVLAGGRLVWGQGPYTCTLDVDTGRTHVIGAAAHDTSALPPAAGGRYVAWIEEPKSGDGRSRLWVYDAERGRRQSFEVDPSAVMTAVGGDLAIWLEGGDPPRVPALDPRTGRRTVIVASQDLDYPVLAADDSVGWTTVPASGAAPAVVVRDLAAGTDTAILLASPGSGLTVGDIQMAGHVVLWTQQSSASTRIVAYDLETRRTETVADGAVENPATDGQVVVWVQPDDASPDAGVVMMRMLGGGPPSVAARPPTWVSGLAVGGGRLAWVVDDGTWTYLDVVDLPS
jgi:hypothetical protein